VFFRSRIRHNVYVGLGMDTILWKITEVFWRDWEDGFAPWLYAVRTFPYPLFDDFHGVVDPIVEVVSVVHVDVARNI